ncbi:MAG: DUF1294 domain-containing protein [Phycisphaerales bacterium JB064]
MPDNPRLWLLFAALAWYTVWGLITFVRYGLDKRASSKGGWRTKEATLRKLELIGGAFGAALAQPAFRHKTSKPGFRALTLLIAAVHGALLCALGWWVFSG